MNSLISTLTNILKIIQRKSKSCGNEKNGKKLWGRVTLLGRKVLFVRCHHCFKSTLELTFSVFVRLLINQSTLVTKTFLNTFFFLTFKKISPNQEFLTTCPLAHWVWLRCWKLTRTIYNLLWPLTPCSSPCLVPTRVRGRLLKGSDITRDCTCQDAQPQQREARNGLSACRRLIR